MTWPIPASRRPVTELQAHESAKHMNWVLLFATGLPQANLLFVSNYSEELPVLGKLETNPHIRSFRVTL